MAEPASPSDQDARTRRHLEFLDVLIAHGMDLASRVHQQATTPTELLSALAAPGIAIPFVTPDIIASFEHISRSVRRAILVSRKLAEPLPLARPGPDVTRQSGPRDAEPDPVPTPRAKTVRTEAADRLHVPELEDRIGNQPIGDIIVGLCRDLGVEPGPDYAGHAAQRTMEQPAPGNPPPAPPRIDHPEDAAITVATARPGSKPEPRPPKPSRSDPSGR